MENNKEFVDNTIEKNSDDRIECSKEEAIKVGFEQTENISPKRKKKKFRIAYNIIRVIAFAIAGYAFGYASYELTDSYLDYISAEEKYSAVDDMFQQSQEITPVEDGNTADAPDSNVSTEYQGNVTKWVWDYDAMLKYNDEAKGYIKLDGTRIQYPIVQHKDNDYYLVRGSDKISNGNGAIFIDARCAGGLDARMSIVYGHNMLDGSMFKSLMDFSKEDFSKKHQIFDVYVGRKHYLYHVFSSFRTKADNEEIYQLGFEDDSDFQKWIDRAASKSNYKYECEKPDVKDKILLLSTCVDDNGNRMVVCLYRGEEVVD